MPGLLTLKTDLKSLKYGHDQPNGGSSNEPYIKVDINNVDNTFNRVRLTSFDDGLVRGGTVAALNASAVDTLRIGKFFINPPKGPLFLTKQVGLQLSNPQLEHKDTLPTNLTGTNRPTRGQGFFRNIGNAITNATTAVGAFISNTANRIENEVGPTRIYNPSGINTLSQISLTAFGGHVVRHGYLPTEDSSKYYEAVVTDNNFQNNHNRLELYASNFSLGGMDSIINKTNWDASTEITSYVGGPSSVYGIGQTRIRRYTNTNDKTKIKFAFSQSQNLSGRTRGDNGDVQDVAFGLDRLLGVSNHTGSIFSISGSTTPPLSNDDNYIPVNLNNRNATTNTNIDDDKAGIHHWKPLSDTAGIKIVDTFDYDLSREYSYSPLAPSGSTFDLSKEISQDQPLFKNQGSDKDKKNPHQRDSGVDIDNTHGLVADGPTSYPDPVLSSTRPFKYELDSLNTVYTYKNPSLRTYAELQQQVESGSKIHQPIPYGNEYFDTVDTSTAIHRNAPDYQYNTGIPGIVEFNRTNDLNDGDDELLLVFDPQSPFSGGSLGSIGFLAYITDYTDNFDSGWNDVKYAGRAEKFYIFNEFKRSISLGFNIPCYNEQELAKKHADLNKLVSILAGKYSGGLMGGVITKLRVGSYVNNLPGIITSLNFSPIQDSSWDLNHALAFYIKVSFNFTVIGDELPEFGTTFIENQRPTAVTPTPTPVSTTSAVPLSVTAPAGIKVPSQLQQNLNLQSSLPLPSTLKTQAQVNAVNPSLGPSTSALGPIQNTSGPSYNQPVPSTKKHFYRYNQIGNIDAEMDENGNIVRTFNPAVTAQSLLKKHR